ncbi:phosphatidate cytidylyltransferase [Mycoplasma sp. SG1]|uniref:phosphatidate cytidylyltransferase n=1 Tax=Mycoplasma sp. SG1 TaxID=2810348 RepID=UPI00202487E0|nr:phosphatidate cytidylyltransferase [Mycoplasma sp. SG1]URM53230.1 phosphatidate cytidylyltransferase [Mycoplasma sp. SG1]
MSPITLLNKNLAKEKEDVIIEHDLLTGEEVKVKKPFLSSFLNRFLYSVVIIIFITLIAVFSYFSNFAHFYQYNSELKAPSTLEKTFACLLIFSLLIVALIMMYEITQFLFFGKQNIIFFTIIFSIFFVVNYFLTSKYFILQFLWQDNSGSASTIGHQRLLVWLLGQDLTTFSAIGFCVSLAAVLIGAIIYAYFNHQLSNKLFLEVVFALLIVLLFKILLFISLYLGLLAIIFIFFLPFISDTSAYLIGKCFGKKKIFPKVSPNKTWIGAISGFLISFSVAFLYIALLKNFVSEDFIQNNLHSYPQSIFYLLNFKTSLKEGFYFILILLLLFFVLSIQFGDFFFSFFKRCCFKKNFSTLLGEHGGLFDRFDSLIFFIFLYFLFFSFLG